MERNNLSKDDALKRIKSQMDVESKKKLSNHIIDNEGNFKELKEKYRKMLKEIL